MIETNPQVIDGIKKMLADTYSLASYCHVAHWNVTGRNFSELHEFFGDLYDELFKESDLIAERLRALKQNVAGGVTHFAKEKTIGGIGENETAVAYLAFTLRSCEAIINEAYKLRKLCGKVDDLENQDFVMAQIQNRQKNAWMLRSFLE